MQSKQRDRTDTARALRWMRNVTYFCYAFCGLKIIEFYYYKIAWGVRDMGQLDVAVSVVIIGLCMLAALKVLRTLDARMADLELFSNSEMHLRQPKN